MRDRVYEQSLRRNGNIVCFVCVMMTLIAVLCPVYMPIMPPFGSVCDPKQKTKRILAASPHFDHGKCFEGVWRAAGLFACCHDAYISFWRGQGNGLATITNNPSLVNIFGCVKAKQLLSSAVLITLLYCARAL